MAKVIGIVSGKGGVGKTTVAVNLAAELQKFGYKTILMEGNFTSPTAAFHLGFLA